MGRQVVAQLDDHGDVNEVVEQLQAGHGPVVEHLAVGSRRPPEPAPEAREPVVDHADRIRSARRGMPLATGSQRPSRRTSYARKAQGIPFARIGSVESISWKWRCGFVEFPVWPTRPITSPVPTCCPSRTATEPGVRCTKAAYTSPCRAMTWLPSTRG